MNIYLAAFDLPGRREKRETVVVYDLKDRMAVHSVPPSVRIGNEQ